MAVVTIDRPEARNTVTYPVLDALLGAFARADADEDVRAVVVTGTGEFFSAGTDLSAGASGYDADSTGFKPLRGGTRDVGGELALRIFGSRQPVIAAINGTAVGIGITMVLPMDIRIGAEGSRFALPFTRRGIVPESCATWFLPRIVGIATAVDWAVTGRTFGAEEAHAAGLLGELLPAEQVLPAPSTSPTRLPSARQRSPSPSPASCCGGSSARRTRSAPTGSSRRRCSPSERWPTPRRVWRRSRRSAPRSSLSPSVTCRSSTRGGPRSRSSDGRLHRPRPDD